ncbi:D-amino-acid oxidase [Aedes aegypti]|uniref:FAD dependent oxidoreductase domain-containing protein n=1 Tax=Aedes aegypti TaxID=7159 RepID=A0A6I8T2X6_AEDAE|nr:D-amino-acid oxidase [Aedes aegypti]XP_021707206.1 D-amino-acid oxidase [Aedes aegypti]
MNKPMKFIILGAGINGLSCAYRISEHYPNARLEIISERFSPNTTSDVAAGLWEPYLSGDTPKQLLRKWSRDTYEYFHKLWKDGRAEECGISLVPFVSCSCSTEPDDIFWKDFVFHYGDLTRDRLEQLSLEHGEDYKSGTEFITFTCEPTKLMKVYTSVLKSRGTVFRQQRIGSIEELAQEASHHTTVIVINCLGLGSRELLNDRKIGPSRGQVRRVEAPWMFHVFCNDRAYVIPNTGSVTMGGIKQIDDYELEARPADTDTIKRGCYGIVPALDRAPVKGEFVGLRPLRQAVRLETEWIKTDGANRFPVIHNYGHGGSGITLSWGCAGEVLNLVRNVICEDIPHSRKSKL